MSVSEKETMARQLWLHYFIRVLYRRGIITQEEYRKLHCRICSGK